MANKTVKVRLIDFIGEAGLVLKLTAEGGTSVLNGSGDALTETTLGVFTCTVTEAISGWCDVVIEDALAAIIFDGKVHIPGDIAGTYIVGGADNAYEAAFKFQQYAAVERSTADDKAISFMFPLPSANFSTKTVSIDGATAVNLTGAVTYEEQLGTYYRYELAYNAADRPTEEGSALYTFSDGTNTRYVTLRVNAGLTDAQAARLNLIGTGQGLTNAPVTADGYINQIIRGDDYLASVGSAFEFNWTARSGYVVGTSTCKFGGISACDGTTVGWDISGTLANNAGVWTLSFDMPRATTAALADDKYDWSVEVTNASGYETTVAKSKLSQPVRVFDKQT